MYDMKVLRVLKLGYDKIKILLRYLFSGIKDAIKTFSFQNNESCL